MPSRRFRKTLLDRVLRSARDVGERGLAFLITAGVASVGAATAGTVAEGCSSSSSTNDGGTVFEAAEAARSDAQVEAPAYNDGGGEGGRDTGVIVEAAQNDAGDSGAGKGDAGCDAPMVEAANFDSGC